MTQTQTQRGATDESGQRQHGFERLLRAVQELSMVRDIDGIASIVRTAARDLTACDGATFVLRDNGQCYYLDEDAISPLWRGSRFPMEACISGWAMLNKATAAIPDIYVDPRIPHEAYRPTFVKSLVMVPIRSLDPVGAIGNYWAEPHTATDDEVRLLQALADATSVAMENAAVWAELDKASDRAAELERISAQHLRHALTDDLTGLRNRRGFALNGESVLEAARTAGQPAALVFADLDGLKKVNDTEGHEAGDRWIGLAGEALAEVAGTGDVVARLGGDEFCGLFVGTAAADIDARLRDAMEGRGVAASIGVVDVEPGSPLTLAQLMTEADARMYAVKVARPARR